MRTLQILALLCLAVSSTVSQKASLRCPYLAKLGLDFQDDANIDAIVEIFTNLTLQNYQSVNPSARMAHVKQHGCVRALVTPMAGIGQLAQGIFASNITRPAFIRFSNGVGRGFSPFQPGVESDVIPDIRGMGLKILNVTGFSFNDPIATSQSYTLTTDNVGFLPDIPTALSFFQAVQAGKLALTAWFAKPSHWHVFNLYKNSATYITDLLTVPWYSPVPTMHGNLIVKHHLSAVDEDVRAKLPEIIGYNGLRDQLQQDLSNSAWSLKWQVQLYQDDESTPVNDITIPWNTPLFDLAYVTIPQQSFGTSGQEVFCDWMNFGPALSVEPHGPVGDAQAIRTAVYAAMMALRHQLMGQVNRDASLSDWYNYPNM